MTTTHVKALRGFRAQLLGKDPVFRAVDPGEVVEVSLLVGRDLVASKKAEFTEPPAPAPAPRSRKPKDEENEDAG